MRYTIQFFLLAVLILIARNSFAQKNVSFIQKKYMKRKYRKKQQSDSMRKHSKNKKKTEEKKCKKNTNRKMKTCCSVQ